MEYSIYQCTVYVYSSILYPFGINHHSSHVIVHCAFIFICLSSSFFQRVHSAQWRPSGSLQAVLCTEHVVSQTLCQLPCVVANCCSCAIISTSVLYLCTACYTSTGASTWQPFNFGNCIIATLKYGSSLLPSFILSPLSLLLMLCSNSAVETSVSTCVLQPLGRVLLSPSEKIRFCSLYTQT